MLAQPQKRQHLPLHHHSTLPSPPPSSQHSQFAFNGLPELSAQESFQQKLLHDYLEQSYPNPVVVDNELPVEPNPFMTGAYDFSNPAIRIQQSTPTPQLPSSFAHTPMLHATNGTVSGLENWNAYANNVQGNNTQSLQTPRTGRTHQRASSSSSIGSNGSQYQAVGPTTSYHADEPSRAFQNHLPTPTHTPTQDSFMNNTNFSNFTPNTSSMDQTMAAHLSMKQALMDQNIPEDDVPGFAHSARHSVSSYGHDSPATPHTVDRKSVV